LLAMLAGHGEEDPPRGRAEPPGGKKGGPKASKARWAGVSPEQRTEILRRASLARWKAAGVRRRRTKSQ